jgi:hypothetical protein
MHAPAPIAVLALVCWSTIAGGQQQRRATVWDLKLGQGIAAQPAPMEFRGFACGSNGGPPRQQLSGFADFARCRAEQGGLHEVYFEYDDELEYIARARDIEREVARWAGTTEFSFPVVVSALFDSAGILKGIRIVTDPRPERRDHTNDASMRRRAEAYVFGAIMASRYGIEAARDCTSLPPAEGESPVGDVFVKLACERTALERGQRIVIRANHFRKPGQSGVNPHIPTELTQGQYESTARLEIYQFAP